jgi:Domain of unknown function (DUF4337)
MNDVLLQHENAEHAAHAAEHGSKHAALLIAVLAAALALSEQQGKKAEITVQQNSILAADSWNQYQAKSIRAAVAQDLSRLAATFDQPSQPELAAARKDVLRQFQADQTHYEADDKDGKAAIAGRAQAFETTRDNALERTHCYDNAAAALELGIVLATASVITMSRMLFRFAGALGVVGVVLGVLGAVARSLLRPMRRRGRVASRPADEPRYSIELPPR